MYIRCILYTSDAADEEDSVDLGGRRLIKKKKIKETYIGHETQNNKHKEIHKQQNKKRNLIKNPFHQDGIKNLQ